MGIKKSGKMLRKSLNKVISAVVILSFVLTNTAYLFASPDTAKDALRTTALVNSIMPAGNAAGTVELIESLKTEKPKGILKHSSAGNIVDIMSLQYEIERMKANQPRYKHTKIFHMYKKLEGVSNLFIEGKIRYSSIKGYLQDFLKNDKLAEYIMPTLIRLDSANGASYLGLKKEKRTDIYELIFVGAESYCPMPMLEPVEIAALVEIAEIKDAEEKKIWEEFLAQTQKKIGHINTSLFSKSDIGSEAYNQEMSKIFPNENSDLFISDGMNYMKELDSDVKLFFSEDTLCAVTDSSIEKFSRLTGDELSFAHSRNMDSVEVDSIRELLKYVFIPENTHTYKYLKENIKKETRILAPFRGGYFYFAKISREFKACDMREEKEYTFSFKMDVFDFVKRGNSVYIAGKHGDSPLVKEFDVRTVREIAIGFEKIPFSKISKTDREIIITKEDVEGDVETRHYNLKKPLFKKYLPFLKSSSAGNFAEHTIRQLERLSTKIGITNSNLAGVILNSVNPERLVAKTARKSHHAEVVAAKELAGVSLMAKNIIEKYYEIKKTRISFHDEDTSFYGFYEFSEVMELIEAMARNKGLAIEVMADIFFHSIDPDIFIRRSYPKRDYSKLGYEKMLYASYVALKKCPPLAWIANEVIFERLLEFSLAGNIEAGAAEDKSFIIQGLVNQAMIAFNEEGKKGIEFGTSGFRGIKGLNELTVAITAQANTDYIESAHLSDKVFAVCRDTRGKGDIFTKITSVVLAANGIKVVVSNGYTPTPVIAHATVANLYGGAINFTASHNPEEYKGYKFTPAHGGAAPQEVTDAMQEKANAYLEALKSADGIRKALGSVYLDAVLDYESMFKRFCDLGDIEFIEPMESYVEYLFNLEMQGKKIFDKVENSPIMAAASGLHGTAGPYFERIFGSKGLDKLVCEVLNKEPREDFGRFNSPMANEENLKDLIDVVSSNDNTLGVSADGDGDREGVIDTNGRFITSNELAAIFYWYLHEIKGLRGGVTKTVATTNLLNALTDKFDEKCYEKQVGFKNFMDEMLSGDVIVAAESSAHIGINAVSWDDAFVCDLLSYQILSDKEDIKAKTGMEFNNLTDILHYIESRVVGNYFSFYEGNVAADDSTKNLLLSWNKNSKLLTKQLNKAEFLSILESSNLVVAEISTLPKKGVKVVFKDGSWFCLRPSGTEPLVRLYTEGAGKSAAIASGKKEALINLAEKLLQNKKGDDLLKASSAGMRSQDRIAVEAVLREMSVEKTLQLLTDASKLSPAEAQAATRNPFARIGFDAGLNRMMLGWIAERIEDLINNPAFMGGVIDFVKGLKVLGIKNAMFTGIGGSGLGVGTIVDTYGQPQDGKIYTLTTPSRDQIDTVIKDLKQRYNGNLKKALQESVLFAISKSGSTAETREQLEYLESRYREYRLDPKEHIIFITDPDTKDKPADKNAFANRIQQGYRWLPIQLDSQNDIGGRFTSPTTMISLLPLVIINPELIRPYLENAYEMVKIKDTSAAILKQQFVTLGVFLDMVSKMKDPRAFNKLTLLLPEELKAFAPWAVQLIHESLGKDNKGIEVLFGEELTPDMANDFTRQGRVFLRVNVSGKADTEPELWQAIEKNGLPTFEIEVNGKEDLGGLQAGLQITTAVFASRSNIPFVIQPAVEKHKKATNDVMSTIKDGKALELPEITADSNIGSKSGRLSVYFDSLIRAGVLTLNQIRAEVNRLGADMNDPAVVYTAIFNLIEKLQRFEQVQLGLFGAMSKKTKEVFAKIRKETFTENGIPSLIATWPDDLHANEQDMADGLGREITFTTAVYPTKAAEIPGGEAVNIKMQNQLAAPFIGLMNSKTESKGMICGIAYDGTQDEASIALEKFFERVNLLRTISKASSAGSKEDISAKELLRTDEQGHAMVLKLVDISTLENLFAELLKDYSMAAEQLKHAILWELGVRIKNNYRAYQALSKIRRAEGEVSLSLRQEAARIEDRYVKVVSCPQDIPVNADKRLKQSSAGIALTDRDIEHINLAAEIANLTDATGTIVYNDTSLSLKQQQMFQGLIGKGTPGLAELEAKLGCSVKLMSQGNIIDNANTIIISTEELSNFKNAKYFITEQQQIDSSYVAIAPLIAIAKGLLGLENKTEQPKLYTALKSSIKSLSQGLLNERDIEAAITAYINGNPMFIKLPLPVSYGYDQLEQRQRQAIMRLIAA